MSDRDDAIQTLRGILTPGAHVYAVLRTESRSKLTTVVEFYACRPGGFDMIGRLIGLACGLGWDDSGVTIRGGQTVSALIHRELSRKLFSAENQLTAEWL